MEVLFHRHDIIQGCVWLRTKLSQLTDLTSFDVDLLSESSVKLVFRSVFSQSGKGFTATVTGFVGFCDLIGQQLD